jgi:hypothetical protein
MQAPSANLFLLVATPFLAMAAKVDRASSIEISLTSLHHLCQLPQ